MAAMLADRDSNNNQAWQVPACNGRQSPLLNDNIGAVVQDICPPSGSVNKGGMPFNISLTAELSEDNKTGITAHFYEIGDAPLEELTPRTLRGIIPWSQQPGTFQVTVSTQAGQLPGTTEFTYVDETLELLKQLVKQLVKLLVKDPAQQAQFFAMGSQDFSSISGSDSNSTQNNGSQQPGTFQVTVSTQAGQLPGTTEFTYVDETLELLKQLVKLLVKDPAQQAQFFAMGSQDFSSISGSDSNSTQNNAVTEDETDFKSGQSEDDDNQSDYFADDETSSCGSLELEVGWEEDEEGTCTTKDGGFKKEPSEGEDASIEVLPDHETGTQFDENLEMTEGDESYEEPSIIDSKHSSLDCLYENILLSAGDDTTASQQGVGEPIEGEDASIEVTPEMGTQFDENLEMAKGDKSCKEPSIFVLLSAGDDTTARQQGVGVEETHKMGSFTQRIGGRTQKIDDPNAEQQDANACPSQERTAKPKKISERDVPPKVAAPSWNRSQAANEKLEKKVEEEQSLASSNGERHQAVSNESLDHLAEFSKVTLGQP
ncbi:hypothetical protein OS493_025686 [Desmophyllum pertusum]|uniref:Uncharacterized protein n=1 Tax=Desmophyllum pertusum TaxID=174260 RepID=A0A9W9ZPW5_9CNID|nr:hypothetical protein OS493_025686 [Desmophyllum pertusum]